MLDGLEEIFEDGLVAAEIADDGGRGALVFVLGGFGEGLTGLSIYVPRTQRVLGSFHVDSSAVEVHTFQFEAGSLFMSGSAA